MTPEEINRKLLIPDWDTVSAIKVNEAKFIYEFIKGENITTTLETGLAFSRSASHIIAATNKIHIAIDPYQDKYKSMGLENLKKLGMDKKLDFRSDFSHNVLPELLKQGKKFDFIFIDGDHKFDGMLVDFYYSDQLVNNEGFILFHDTWMRSTRLVESFIKTNRSDYKHIKTPLRNFTLFRKVGQDKRDGMYFREFYTKKSLLTHSIIRWMATGKDSFPKRFILKLKDLLK